MRYISTLPGLPRLLWLDNIAQFAAARWSHSRCRASFLAANLRPTISPLFGPWDDLGVHGVASNASHPAKMGKGSLQIFFLFVYAHPGHYGHRAKVFPC